MIYIALDTCVWLELLKVDFNQEDNPFDELLYWIENDMAVCITTENLLLEWTRNKIAKRGEVIKAFKNISNNYASLMSAGHPLNSLYSTDKVEEVLNHRIARLDKLFSTKAEIAKESEEIYIEAAKRNLNCIAPNHLQDSFRDTVNILTLKYYVWQKSYGSCIFTTINYRDYSEIGKRYELHNQLRKDFEDGRLQYVFFENSSENFSGRLFKQLLRPALPSFQDHLKSVKEKLEEKKLEEKKRDRQQLMKLPEPDFLPYTFEIDRILLKDSRTELDEFILKFLFDKNPKYENYFLRKLAEYGMV